jgi:hypothetical protein
MIPNHLIIFILTTVSCVVFPFIFLSKFCSKCVNFSLMISRVPREIVEEYVNKNPVIRETCSKNINL